MWVSCKEYFLKSFFSLVVAFWGLLGTGGYVSKSLASQNSSLDKMPSKTEIFEYWQNEYLSRSDSASGNAGITAGAVRGNQTPQTVVKNFRNKHEEFIKYHRRIIDELYIEKLPQYAVEMLSQKAFSPYFLQYMLRDEIRMHKADVCAVVFTFIRAGYFGGLENPDSDPKVVEFTRQCFSLETDFFTSNNISAICDACQHYNVRLSDQQVASLGGAVTINPIPSPQSQSVGQAQNVPVPEAHQQPPGAVPLQPGDPLTVEEIKTRLSCLPDDLDEKGGTTKLLTEKGHPLKSDIEGYRKIIEKYTIETKFPFKQVMAAGPHMTQAWLVYIADRVRDSKELTSRQKHTILAYSQGFLDPADGRFMLTKVKPFGIVNKQSLCWMNAALQMHYNIPFLRNFIFFIAACGRLLRTAGFINDSSLKTFVAYAKVLREMVEQRKVNAESIYYTLECWPANEIQVQRDLMDFVRFLHRSLQGSSEEKPGPTHEKSVTNNLTNV
jgi:hypothetical protein